ncbi:MAG: hypothetical protein JRJ12_07920 [Deltaproteobacteria bacterium]|nr:hypothetical protein [Deltaproteobacteria bacterium]MBW2071385.1 hypothetical protein [Deltaproteobacteria bacterium]
MAIIFWCVFVAVALLVIFLVAQMVKILWVDDCAVEIDLYDLEGIVTTTSHTELNN